MMLAGVLLDDAVADLADTVRATGADGLADRLDRALHDGVALLALTIDERARSGGNRTRVRFRPALPAAFESRMRSIVSPLTILR